MNLILFPGSFARGSTLEIINVGEPGSRRIKELGRFRERLAEVVATDAIPVWLDTPNEALDGLKPLEVIECGEIDRL